jgi:lactate racemase-like protein
MKISFDVPEEMLQHLLGHVQIPHVALIRQRFDTPPGLTDVPAVVRERLQSVPIAQPGERIAIAVGSRGIARLPDMVTATVGAIRDAGAEPFIVPAMGSHGGATAEGQRAVLAHLGVTANRVGADVVSDMATQVVGYTADGTPVHIDRQASQADGIVVIVRVKPHTAFRGPYESGLAKMISIGLGKQVGASLTHARGFGEMARMVPQMAEVALGAVSIRCGIASLENAYDEPFKIAVVPADRIMVDEPALLDEARAAMPSIPFKRFDVLVIDRIGKDISGDGADPNITGRYPTPFASGGPEVNKYAVLDLTEGSTGNANGAGTADFTTVRLAEKMDLAGTYPNALTSTVARPVALPMVLPNDRLAIAAALHTCNAVGRRPTMVRIVDTLHLERFWASESLLQEQKPEAYLETLEDARPMPFDADGNLKNIGSNVLAIAPS